MTTSEYQVTGMSCAHCEAAIRGEVERIPGVTAATVSAGDGRLVVEAAASVGPAAVLAAVDEAGYDAVPVSVRAS